MVDFWLEFLEISRAVAIGFLVMGFIGFAVKLVHIPINNILVFLSPDLGNEIGWKKLKRSSRNVHTIRQGGNIVDSSIRMSSFSLHSCLFAFERYV